MAAFLSDEILDNGLSYPYTDLGVANLSMWIIDDTPASVPTDYSTCNTNKCGNRDDPPAASPALADHTSGRKLTVAAITDGSVTATATAKYWALIDTQNSALVAANTLSSTQSVTSGNTFTLDAVIIAIPDPTA